MSKIADNNISVEADHLQADHRDPDARLAMPAFISSIDTGLLRLPWNSPFSSRTERVAATMAIDLFPAPRIPRDLRPPTFSHDTIADYKPEQSDTSRTTRFLWLDSASNNMKGYWMLKKAGFVTAAFFLFTLAALGQDKGHFDASFNGALVLTRSSSGNGIQQSATVGSNYFGTFRFKFKPKHSLLFNIGSARNSQIYQTNFDFHVLTKTTEYSGAYMYTLFDKRKFQPFVLIGAGALSFNPQSTWLFLPDFVPGVPNRVQAVLNTSKQTQLMYLYGGGFDYRLPWKFALRVQYRGLIYNAPSFNVNAALTQGSVNLSTGSKGYMSEPSIGLVFKF
jgi:opacity protein-like surface antigen